jgi:hypothetical protein
MTKGQIFKEGDLQEQVGKTQENGGTFASRGGP